MLLKKKVNYKSHFGISSLYSLIPGGEVHKAFPKSIALRLICFSASRGHLKASFQFPLKTEKPSTELSGKAL
jgi:hypothetical protein